MELNFLKNFTKRMKNVGAYALLFRNILPKQTWKQYGLTTFTEQTNVVFSVLLFIMEQTLKEEVCTVQDIGNFLDTINVEQLKKNWSYDSCKELADFIVNDILCEQGRAMYFEGFDYEDKTTQNIHISFIANKIVYVDGDVRRTSYYLTDDGYNLMLSTLEIESNLKLTIHEMIFHLHLEKASYDKAVDDIKNIFNLLRIQLKRMEEAMRKIRQNALQFSVEDYKDILEGNLATIDETKKKFVEYRVHVVHLVAELEEKNIHVEKLNKDDWNNLKNLKIIEEYLNRALDEYQKILSSHFDLKALYTKELESLSQMSLIKRFSLRNDFYEKVLKDAGSLENMDVFFRPLFHPQIEKTYYIGKAFEYQKRITMKEEEDTEELDDFDSEEWLREQAEKLEEKMMLYKRSLAVLLRHAVSAGRIRLSEIQESLAEEERKQLIPNVEIFREIMIELLKNGTFDIEALQKEREEHFEDQVKEFQINFSLLELLEEYEKLRNLKRLTVFRAEEKNVVLFENVMSESGRKKKIRCSDIVFLAE